MGEFVRILKICRSVIVSLQLLQTLSIMIQNLKSEHAICKLVHENELHRIGSFCLCYIYITSKAKMILLLNFLLENFADYMFSNEHLNFLITYAFDFHNEELLSYYISFLRCVFYHLSCPGCG